MRCSGCSALHRVNHNFKKLALTMSEFFKNFYWNLANNLVRKLSDAAKIICIKSLKIYGDNMFNLNINRLTLKAVQTNSVSNVFKKLT